jgi:iron complex transport system ATP-binding protein
MILRVDDLNFRYNGRPVLSEVTLEVARGQVVAVLGPNGAGKSTLLRCINAILRPRSGTVMVESEDVLKLDAMAVARRIGYVAQHQSAGKITAFDAILMGRRPHIRMRVRSEDLRIVDGAVKQLGLEALALRPIDRMSGGELQKVAVGRALVQEPRLLLMDEPTSSLDLKNQVEILKLIRRVVREHAVAAVITLHDLTTAFRFADQCLFLKNGGIHAAVKPQAVDAAIVGDVFGIAVEIHRHNGFPVVIPQ